MKFICRNIGKLSKPIPKKGSPEYVEMQKRLQERKVKMLPETQEEEKFQEKMNKGFKYALWGATLPLTYGILKLALTDSLAISLAFTGSWVGFTGLFLKSAELGLEVFLHKKPFYMLPKNTIFVGSFRVFSCFFHVPMSFLCIWSSMTQSWSGLSAYFVYQQLVMLASIKSTNEFLTPAWLGSSHWMYLIYSQIAVIIMIYSIINSIPEEQNSFDDLIKVD
jgi:hypothetical protein